MNTRKQRVWDLIIDLTILVIAVMLFARWMAPTAPQDQALDAFRAKADSAMHKADSLGQRVLDREAQIVDLQTQIDRLKRKPPDTAAVRRLRQHTDSLYAELGDSLMTVADSLIPKQQRVILGQDTVIRWQQHLLVLQDTVIQVKDQVVADLKTSNTILRQTLEQIPPPKPPRERWLGLIPKPTLKEVITGSVITGVVGGALLFR